MSKAIAVNNHCLLLLYSLTHSWMGQGWRSRYRGSVLSHVSEQIDWKWEKLPFSSKLLSAIGTYVTIGAVSVAKSGLGEIECMVMGQLMGDRITRTTPLIRLGPPEWIIVALLTGLLPSSQAGDSAMSSSMVLLYFVSSASSTFGPCSPNWMPGPPQRVSNLRPIYF